MEELIKDKKELSESVEKLINEFMHKHKNISDVDIEISSIWDGNKQGRLTYLVNLKVSF